MCGRVAQASDPLRFTFVDGLNLPDSRVKPASYKCLEPLESALEKLGAAKPE